MQHRYLLFRLTITGPTWVRAPPVWFEIMAWNVDLISTTLSLADILFICKYFSLLLSWMFCVDCLCVCRELNEKWKNRFFNKLTYVGVFMNYRCPNRNICILYECKIVIPGSDFYRKTEASQACRYISVYRRLPTLQSNSKQVSYIFIFVKNYSSYAKVC